MGRSELPCRRPGGDRNATGLRHSDKVTHSFRSDQSKRTPLDSENKCLAPGIDHALSKQGPVPNKAWK